MSCARAQQLLADGYGRVAGNVAALVDGLSLDDVHWQPADGANSVGWLLWHIGRMEDHQVADLAGTDSVWERDGWRDRFALPYRPRATGYGQSAADVAAFRVADTALLTGYYAAVHAATLDYVGALTEAELDRVVDAAWDPPVTAAVRLVSILDDAAQHVGQAAYVRGLLATARPSAT
jgi:uncharacterized damage-inducible protein DinB